jgi:hypothetical protein
MNMRHLLCLSSRGPVPGFIDMLTGQAGRHSSCQLSRIDPDLIQNGPLDSWKDALKHRHDVEVSCAM